MRERAVLFVDFYKLRTVFLTTFRIGARTFGGSFPMIPLLKREFVTQRHWVEESDIEDVFTAAQSLPGAVAINAAILLGYRAAGAFGGALAAFGMALPSLIVLSITAAIYNHAISHPYVLGFMRGAGAAVAAILLHTVVSLFRHSARDAFGYALFSIATLLTILGLLHPAVLVAGGGALGFLYSLILRKRKGAPLVD